MSGMVEAESSGSGEDDRAGLLKLSANRTRFSTDFPLVVSESNWLFSWRHRNQKLSYNCDWPFENVGDALKLFSVAARR
jgi:hypothetical protein